MKRSTRGSAWFVTLMVLMSIVFLVASSTKAAASIYYVAQDGGNDLNPCRAGDETNAKRTIAEGIKCLASGDTLNIKAGTYNEGLSGSEFIRLSGTSYDNATTIQAFGSDVVTLDGIGFNSPGTGLAIRYVIFRNLIFDGANVVGLIEFGGGGKGGAVDHIKLDGVEVKNLQSFPGVAAAIVLAADSSDSIWITNSKIHDTGCGTDNQSQHAIYVSSSNHLIENTEIYNATGYGIHQYSGSPSNNVYRYNRIHDTGHSSPCDVRGAASIILWSAGGAQVYGNLLTNNQGGIGVASDNNLIYNNTVYGNGIGFESEVAAGRCCYPGILVDAGWSGNVVQNNIVFGNAIDSVDTTGSATRASNNLTSDPQFVNAAGNDFHLQSTSPAINAGAILGAPYNVDLDRVTHPIGCCYDIGAY